MGEHVRNQYVGSISEIQERVIPAFNDQSISIPYPVQEVKVYRGEGHEGESARAK